MANQPAIILEDVSKLYHRGQRRRKDLKGSLAAWLFDREAGKTESFYALKDINLSIDHGDIVGIMGPNGAGKSTLLKLLSRITYPTTGTMTMYGTLSSMLEVGTGFHPELTGRENIFLNGAIIGMKRAEVSRKLDSIIEFSGVEDFLDTPVKHYSSGMYVRLAFSVAAHLEPDILLVDEVLAVGDHEFRKKCLHKLLDVSGQGRTILMVSHQLGYLKALCKTGIFLDSGEIRYIGPIEETINTYVSHYEGDTHAALHSRIDRKGSGVVRVTGIDVLDKNGYSIRSVLAGDDVSFLLQLSGPQEDVYNVWVQIECFDMYGQLWFLANNEISGQTLPSMRGEHTLRCHIPRLPLNAQMYFINVMVYVSKVLSDEVKNVVSFEVEPGMFYSTGKMPPPNKGMLVDYEWE